jgi:ribonuclease BN (tRNA processing enzyme)
MKLTVIGQYGPYPEKGGRTSCYLTQTDKAAFALDFGSGASGGIAKYLKRDTLDAIFLSHLHFDHISDIFPFIYYCEIKKIRPKVILPFTESMRFNLIAGNDTYDIVKAQDALRLNIKDAALSFCAMTHPVESYAIKITSGGKTLIYSGDTSFNDKIIPFCKGADAILLDCGNFHDQKYAPHCSPRDANFVADKTGARIIMTHLYPGHKYVSNHPRVLIAEEGKTYEI